MSKIINVLLIVLFPIISLAQDSTTRIEPLPDKAPPRSDYRKFRLGLEFSPGFASINAQTKNFEKESNNFGFTTGLHYENYFGKNYAFMTGLFFTRMGGEVKIDSLLPNAGGSSMSPVFGANYSYHINYIEIPLAIKLKTPEYNFINYFFHLGFTPGFVYTAKADVTPAIFANIDDNEDRSVNAGRNDFNPAGSSMEEDNIRLLRFGFQVGIGGEYNFDEDLSLMVGLKYNTALTNSFRAQNTEGFTNLFSIQLGLLF